MVHLFNMAGYRLVFNYYIRQSNDQLVQQLDNDQYTDEELIELKVALHLPYMSSSDYERVDGNIEIDGKHYNYVKRKVSNDTLFVMCLPNTTKTKLVETRNQLNGQASDMNTEGKGNTTAKKSQPLGEYNQLNTAYNFSNNILLSTEHHFFYTPLLPQPFTDSSFQPPDVKHA